VIKSGQRGTRRVHSEDLRHRNVHLGFPPASHTWTFKKRQAAAAAAAAAANRAWAHLAQSLV